MPRFHELECIREVLYALKGWDNGAAPFLRKPNPTKKWFEDCLHAMLIWTPALLEMTSVYIDHTAGDDDSSMKSAMIQKELELYATMDQERKYTSAGYFVAQFCKFPQ